jgi:hypothetical protein
MPEARPVTARLELLLADELDVELPVEVRSPAAKMEARLELETELVVDI